MSTPRSTVFLVLALLALSAGPPACAAKVISDATFNPADWSETVYSTSGLAIQGALQFVVGGNPGAYRQMSHGLPPQSSIGVFHQYLADSYDPATDGPICSVDYLEDRIEFTPPFAGAAIGANPALVQGGIIYFGPNITFSNTSWLGVQLGGLTAADFASAISTHPDFSAGGAPIRFGFARSNSNASTTAAIATTHGIDNWSVSIMPFPPGDYDLDCDVDAADYAFWNEHYGATSGLGLQADGNQSGRVDAADYTIWRDHLGEGGVGAIASAVPEPAVLILVAAAGVGLGIIGARRRLRLSALPPHVPAGVRPASTAPLSATDPPLPPKS